MNSKQREELQRISAAITVNTLPSGVLNIACKISSVEVKHIVDTILAEPLRNCDVGTAEEQYCRFRECCKKQKMPCLLSYDYGCDECYSKWSQMPYEEEK